MLSDCVTVIKGMIRNESEDHVGVHSLLETRAWTSTREAYSGSSGSVQLIMSLSKSK